MWPKPQISSRLVLHSQTLRVLTRNLNPIHESNAIFLLEFYKKHKNLYLYIFRGRKILKMRRSINIRGKYVEFAAVFHYTRIYIILLYYIFGSENIY